MTKSQAARILHPKTSIEAMIEYGSTIDDVNEACVIAARSLRDSEAAVAILRAIDLTKDGAESLLQVVIKLLSRN